MEFRTKVELPIGECEIRHDSLIMSWGSCFADNISRKLIDNKFSCDANPFGVLYNPLSVAQSLQILLHERYYTENDLQYANGQWFSLMHHGSFSSADKDECLNGINERIRLGAANLRKARIAIITWGTARVYEWSADGSIVGNCHKLPEKMFRRRLLDVDEIVEKYVSLISEILNCNPDLHFLFTVSPIRHAKDGFHGNQLNKATLLIALHKICEQLPCCHYFPSYEIMMDELRDYRFYADDMLHPSPLAVEYIWQCFCDTYFKQDTLQIMRQWEDIRKGIEHRPFNAESDAYRRFLSQILLKIEKLKEKFPYLDLQNEISLCQTRLKK